MTDTYKETIRRAAESTPIQNRFNGIKRRVQLLFLSFVFGSCLTVTGEVKLSWGDRLAGSVDFFVFSSNALSDPLLPREWEYDSQVCYPEGCYTNTLTAYSSWQPKHVTVETEVVVGKPYKPFGYDCEYDDWIYPTKEYFIVLVCLSPEQWTFDRKVLWRETETSYLVYDVYGLVQETSITRLFCLPDVPVRISR